VQVILHQDMPARFKDGAGLAMVEAEEDWVEDSAEDGVWVEVEDSAGILSMATDTRPTDLGT
jgi:hypothetical protein